MKKVLYFGLAHHNYPMDSLVSIKAADTAVTFIFNTPLGTNTVGDTVSALAVVACVSGNEKLVIEQVMEEFNHGQDYLVDVLALPAVTAITSSELDVTAAS